jgi:hypothetical protein
MIRHEKSSALLPLSFHIERKMSIPDLHSRTAHQRQKDRRYLQLPIPLQPFLQTQLHRHQILRVIIPRVAIPMVNLKQKSPTLRRKQLLPRSQTPHPTAIAMPALPLLNSQGNFLPIIWVTRQFLGHGLAKRIYLS